MPRFTVQSVIFYRVNSFAMPGMQCVVYALEYKDIKSPCCNQLFVAMTRIQLPMALQLWLQLNKTVHVMSGM